MADVRDLIVRIKGDTSDFEKSMGGVSSQSNNAGLSFGKLTGAMVSGQVIFAGLTAVLHGVEDGIGAVKNFMEDSFQKAIDLDGATLKLQRNFGLTAEQASGLIGVFDRFGIGVDSVSKAFTIFQKNLLNVTDSESVGIKAITELGVATTDGAGHLRNMSDVLGDVSEKFKNGTVPATQAAATAAKLFGRSGADLIPVLLQGKDGIANLTEELKKNGLVLDQQSISTYKNFAKNQADLNEKMQGFKVTLGNAVMPIISQAITNMNKWIDAHGGVAKIVQEKVMPRLKEIIEWVKDFVTNHLPGIIKGLENFAKGLVITGEVFGAIFKGIGAVIHFFHDDVAGVIWDILQIMGRLADFIYRIPQYIGAAFRGLVDIITYPFRTAFNIIADLWNGTVGKLNIKVPSWVPGIGGKGFDMPQLPHLAEGGIVTKPTVALIGEAGPEAVVPLGKGKGGMGVNLTVNMGMYAGMPVEKRQIALELYKELVRAARAQGVQLPIVGSAGVQ